MANVRRNLLFVSVIGVALLGLYSFLSADSSDSVAMRARLNSDAPDTTSQQTFPALLAEGTAKKHDGQLGSIHGSSAVNNMAENNKAPESSAWKAPLPEIDAAARGLLIPPGNDEHPRIQLEGEGRDVYWADVMEIALKNRGGVLEQIPGTSVKSSACRSTLCEIQITTTAAASEFTNYEKLNKVLPVSEFSRVSSTILPNENGGLTIYVYGTRRAPEK